MNVRILALIAGLASSSVATAHEGHDHDAPALSADGVKARAVEEVARLVSIKKIEASWKGASAKSVEKKGTEWLVTFENLKAKDKDRTLLYVFLKSSGDFVAANFTGK